MSFSMAAATILATDPTPICTTTEPGLIGTITDWLIMLMETIGGIGVALAIALESIFPPIPSEVILPLAGFPWIALDLQPLGWWFRLTGAHASEILFSGLGFEVTREGTSLLVQGMPVEVSAACAGMNALQSVLIAGAFLAYVLLGKTKAYHWNLLLLLPLAWCANTARIVTITAAAMTWGRDFAMGMFHTWGGLLVLILMFMACWIAFQWQANVLANRLAP